MWERCRSWTEGGGGEEVIKRSGNGETENKRKGGGVGWKRGWKMGGEG